MSGDSEITSWGICPDCLELREGVALVEASEPSTNANRRSDGPEQQARPAGRIVRVLRTPDVPTATIG